MSDMQQDPRRQEARRQDLRQQDARQQDMSRQDSRRQYSRAQSTRQQGQHRQEARSQDPRCQGVSQQDPRRQGVSQQDPRRQNARRQDPRRQAAGYQTVNYRQARQDASHKRLMRIVYGAVGALVVVAVAFGVMAVMNNGSSSSTDGKSGNEALSPGAVADVSGSSSGASGSSAASSSANSQDLAGRAADFAVDPNKTDWNFSTNGKKTVYLTIDDGPSAMTPQVLDILDRYGCKATFFVVGHNEDCYHYIKEAFDRGHTIGLHTMTHDYATVYSSTDAYYADLDAIGQVVKDQIGFVPCFIRFPGGSSNAVSADYSPGIMTELTQSVQTKGYQYYDWNLSVGDGSEHTADEIAGYGTADDGSENIMLLCHDSATKQATVDALPRIIEHYQALGYEFDAIDRSSWVCHHGVNN